MGYAAWLEWQLQPEAIDDAVADEKLRWLPELRLSRRELYDMGEGEWRALMALQQGIVARAVHSRRQLYERVVEFWRDHFNISMESDVPHDLVLWEEHVLRPHALGSFRDLLIATAKSPAMLMYLDNFSNIVGGPNENYARELMELHTLGVDGGYTEADVKEVARAFTGWTIHNGTRTGFYFNPDDHDSDAKSVLGHSLPAGRGIEDGLHVLSILANHPATAQYLSRKLCVRFVSDRPSQNLIDSVSSVWQQTNGDIRSVLRAIFLSDEFTQSAGQKLRRPFDFYVGTLRATGTEVRHGWQAYELLQTLGQMPYGWPAPNGYPDAAGAWMSTSGLLQRWNTAMQLSHGAYSDPELGYGLSTDLYGLIGAPQSVGELVDAVASRVFGVPLSGSHREDFVRYTADDGDAAEGQVTPHLLARKLGSLFGLMLASPLYQWR